MDSVQIDVCNWPPCPETGRPVWFWVIENVNHDLTLLGMDAQLISEFIQRLKTESLIKLIKKLNKRGNMLNLRKKHIPRIQEIYLSLFEEVIIQE